MDLLKKISESYLYRLFLQGGMWGMYNKRNRSMANQIFQKIIDLQTSHYYNYHKNQHNQDKHFLEKFVYPLLRDNSIIQDSYTCLVHGDGSEPFPTQMKGSCYVGHAAYISGNCESGSLSSTCPVECRPKEHKDWIHC